MGRIAKKQFDQVLSSIIKKYQLTMQDDTIMGKNGTVYTGETLVDLIKTHFKETLSTQPTDDQARKIALKLRDALLHPQQLIANPDANKPIDVPAELQPITAGELVAKDIPPVRVIIPGYMTEGTYILSSRSGAGKTWLALAAAESVSTGKPFMGVTPAVTGKVLFIQIQLGDAVMKERLQVMGSNLSDNFKLITADSVRTDGKRATPTRNENLTTYLSQADKACGGGIVLVIIDIWRLLVRSAPRGQDKDQVIYEQIMEINRFCNDNHAACLILHHNRKRGRESMYHESEADEISGSNALESAAKGGVWVISGGNDENEAEQNIYCRSKSTKDGIRRIIAVRRDGWRWQLIGTDADRAKKAYESNPVVTTIRHLLEDSGKWYGTYEELYQQIIDFTGIKLDSSAKLSKSMREIMPALYTNDRITHKRDTNKYGYHTFMKNIVTIKTGGKQD